MKRKSEHVDGFAFRMSATKGFSKTMRSFFWNTTSLPPHPPHVDETRTDRLCCSLLPCQRASPVLWQENRDKVCKYRLLSRSQYSIWKFHDCHFVSIARIVSCTTVSTKIVYITKRLLECYFRILGWDQYEEGRTC